MSRCSSSGADDGFVTDFPGAREVSTRSSRRRSTTRSSSAGESPPPFRAGAARSTIASCRPRPVSRDAHLLRKGCYPGQEPVARLHYRGHPNRGLRVSQLDDVPPYDAELVHDGKVVGRVTSAARRGDGSVVALAYVRPRCPMTRRSRSAERLFYSALTKPRAEPDRSLVWPESGSTAERSGPRRRRGCSGAPASEPVRARHSGSRNAGLDDAVDWLLHPPAYVATGPEPSDRGLPLAPNDAAGHDHLWWLDRMVRGNRPLVERMTLIWHDWFATSNQKVASRA